MERSRYIEPIHAEPNLVLLGKGERVVVPGVENHPSVLQVIDPERTAYRTAFEAAVKKEYSAIPVGLPEQVVYLAGTGREFLALFPGDTSEIRVTSVQQKVIREIAENDYRFNRYKPDYNDQVRQGLHNRIAQNYPDLRGLFDEDGLTPPVKDTVKKMLIAEYPYFDDLIAAVESSGGLKGVARESFELLHTENRITIMRGQLKEVKDRIVPTVEPTVYQKGVVANLEGSVDDSGNIKEGKIVKAIRQYEALRSFPLPEIDVIKALKPEELKPAPQSGEVFKAS